MTMVDTDQLSEAIHSLKGAASTALANPSVEGFEAFEKYVNEIEAFVREVQQAMWATDAKQTIRHLEKGVPLDETDRAVIRTFLISDAERYVALENNYDDWLRELERLVDDLERRVHTVDRYNIGDLRGALKDAIRLVPDIRNYLDEKRRIDNFEQATESLDKQSCDMLVRLLKEQLSSSKR